MADNPIRLLILSDLHYDYFGRKWEKKGDDEDSKIFTGSQLLRRLGSVMEEKVGLVDHIIIPGDFTNRGYKWQLIPISSLLRGFSPEKLSIVPGNHDLCPHPIFNILRLKAFRRQFINHLGQYIPDASGGVSDFTVLFPYTKKITDDTTIIGLHTSTDIITRFSHSIIGFSASIGSVGTAQMEKLKNIVTSENLSDCRIIIVMHHDPFSSQNPWTELGDSESFKNLIDELSEQRKLIIICGHSHTGAIDYPNKNILHIQPEAFCGKRTTGKGRYIDITINSDLSYSLNE